MVTISYPLNVSFGIIETIIVFVLSKLLAIIEDQVNFLVGVIVTVISVEVSFSALALTFLSNIM